MKSIGSFFKYICYLIMVFITSFVLVACSEGFLNNTKEVTLDYNVNMKYGNFSSLINDFMIDYNNATDSNIIVSDFINVPLEDFNKFLQNEKVQYKWDWLFDLLLKNNKYNNNGRKYEYNSEKHIYELAAFLNSTEYSNGSNIVTYDYGTNDISKNVILNRLVVKMNKNKKVDFSVNRNGYEFLGWKKGINEDLYAMQITDEVTVLYADYKVKQYSIQFFNGSDEIEDLKIVYDAFTKVELPDYEASGVEFIGWKLDESSEFIDYIEYKACDIKLYLAVNKLVYNVKFIKDGKELEDLQYSYEYDNNGNDLSLPVLYDSYGNAHKGWSLNKDLTGEVYNSSYECVNRDLVFYLVAFDEVYNITFYKGDEKLEYLSLKFIPGESKELPKYNEIGYTFDGWYLDKELTQKVTSTLELKNDTLLYLGQDLVEYNIKFYYKNQELTEYALSYTVLDDVTLPVVTYEGYKFSGWYRDISYTVLVENIKKGTASDFKLYLRLEAIGYTIEFYDDNTEIPSLQMTFIVGESVNLPIYEELGYNILGWYYDEQLTNKASMKLENLQAENIKLYLKKELITYVISFYDGSNELPTLKQNYTVLDEVILDSYEIDGYSFTGWYCEKELVNKITKIEKGTTGDIKLYLKKELIRYVIDFYDGSNELTTLKQNYTVLDEVILDSYEIDGYSFTGWYCEKELINKITKIEKGTTGDIKLYLKKDVVTYSVDFYYKEQIIQALSTTYTVLDEVELPEYTVDDNLFNGWYLEEELINKVIRIEKGTTGNKTFYLSLINLACNEVLVVSERHPENTVIEYLDKYFVFGKTAFNTINDALDNVNVKGVIYVLDGTFTESVTIDKAVTLVGNNNQVNPNKGLRNEESVINGAISIKADDVGIKGFLLVNEVSSDVAITNLTYQYNISNNLSLSDVTNLEIDCCNFDQTGINVQILNGLNIANTKFTSAGKAVHVENSTGSVVFTNNEINNAVNAVFINNITNAVGDLDISNNAFINITGIAIDLDDSENNSNIEFNNVKINNNLFDNVYKCVWYGAISTPNATFNYNVIDCAAGNYVVKGSKCTAIDGSKNLFISAYKSTLFNAGCVNYSSYYPSVADYLEVTGIVNINYPEKPLELNDNLILEVDCLVEHTISFVSSNEGIAIVDEEGLVSTIDAGEVVITIYITTAYGVYSYDIYLTVVNNIDGLHDLIEYLVAGHNGEVFTGNVNYIGAVNYNNYVYGSVNSYYPANLPVIDNTTYQITSLDDYGGKRTGSLEFIVIHDTGASYSWSDAKANSSYGLEVNSSSWHYTVDDKDVIYQLLDDSMAAWHAGDGGTNTKLFSTGIKVTDVNHRPVVTIGTDGYYYLDGIKSTLKPATNIYSGSVPTSNSPLPYLGLPAVIKNGYYYIPYIYYNSTYQSYAIKGGVNSIGIESCVNNGSDLFKTWHVTAKLTANLLVKYNLTPDRVLFHNNFANKMCPNTMINADLVDVFLKMVYVEYYIAKNFSDFTITFTSSNPELIDNNGRLLKDVKYTTYVPYTITVTNGSVTESITLNAIVKGTIR